MLISDKQFNSHFAKELKLLAGKHWTPASIAVRAATFLVNKPGVKVLDIGSGSGKFCIIGAAYSDGVFTGVEQRQNLCMLAEKVAKSYHLRNVTFIHANMMDVEFKDYDAFFFYNSFYENIEQDAAIDTSVDLDASLYRLNTQQLSNKLACMPKGTRLVTYWGNWEPQGYELVYRNGNDSLRFWEKG